MRRLAIVVALVVVADNSSLAQPQKIRNVAVPPDTNIPSLMLPDDDLLTVEIGGPGLIQCSVGGGPPLTLDEELGNVLAHAGVIVVAEVVRSESVLVREQTWIETAVTLAPKQVIKDTNPSSLESDGSITFHHSGGEIQVGGTRVRANYYHAYEPGGRYLMFIRKIRRESHVIVGVVGFPFRIMSDERLAPMLMSTGKPMTAPSPLYDMSLEDVISELMRRMNPQ